MIHSRYQRLISLLSTEVESKSSTLIKQLGISEATLRRHLSELADSGKIIRTHGGALLRPEALNEASFIDKEQSAPEHKRSIAACAAGLVPTGASIYIDSGTTCLELARLLLRRGDCQIFTNSLPVMVEACKHNANVTGIGGKLREVSRALIGPTALNWLEHLNFDYSIMGASAANIERGVFTTETQEASVKQYAIQSSEKSILLCDSSKWSASAPVCFAHWSDFDCCVVDEALSPSQQSKLTQQLTLHIAPSKES